MTNYDAHCVFFGKYQAPMPGDLFVCSAGGGVGTAVQIGEILDGDPIREAWWAIRGMPQLAPGVMPPWSYEHAGIYVGGMEIVQAQPGGAVKVGIHDWQLGRKWVMWSTGLFPDMSPTERSTICLRAEKAAEMHIGYSWADYLALAAHRLGIGTKALRDYIGDSDHMICSQLDDWCYAKSGVQIFNDKRWPGFVTPANLAQEFVRRARVLQLV